MAERSHPRGVRAASLALLTVALAACAPQSQAQTTPRQPVALAPPGAGSLGVFDPSLASAGDGAVYMAFSAVDPPAYGGRPSERVVSTYLARTGDGGGRWDPVGGVVNPAVPVTLGPAAGGGPATWHNEVPALLHDPFAPPAQRWKLLWHHYLVAGERRLFEHGWIGYRAAAVPEALAGAPEVKLFGALGYDGVNDIPNGPTRSPVAGAPRVPLHQRAPALARCAAFTEPALAATPSAVLLAMNCAEFIAGRIEPKIVLLRCDRPCRMARPESWRYVDTLLDTGDAGHVRADSFSASAFHSDGAAHFLIVSPTSDRPFPDAYNGCIAFRFTDVERGQLLRDGAGRPVPAQSAAGLPNSFNGACSADAGAYGGRLLLGEVAIRGGRAHFGIFVTDAVVR